LLKREVEETELRAIFASSPDAITVTDLDGSITDCNQATLDLHGYSSKEELIGKSAFELIANKDHKRAMENLKKTLEQGSVRNIEYTFLAKDGREFPAELSASVFKDSSGNPIGFVAVTKDITERKKAEEELRETENYLDNLLSYANAPIIVWDNKKRITLFNHAFEAFTGYKKESMLGRNIDVLFPPLQKEEILQTIEKATKGEKWKSVEIPILCKDKETKIALWNSANITDKEGRIVATIAQGQDITERKRMEEKLSESEERFRNLYESIQDPVVVWVGREGRLIEYNEAFKEQVGYTDEELKDKIFLDFVDPDDRAMVLEKYRTKYSEEELPLVYEIRALNKNGEIIPLEISVSPYKVKGKVVGVEAIGRDITERKKAERALKDSEQKLRDTIDNSPDTIVWTDTTGKITLVNKKGFEITGYSEKELVGKNFMDVKALTQESKEKILESFLKRLEGIDTPPYEVEVIAKNGEIIPAELSASPIFEEGKIVGTQSIFRDLRERKRAEEMLRESEEQFRNLFESIQDPVGVYVGREGRLIEYNEAFKKLSGYTDEELKNKLFLDLVHPDDQAMVLEKYRTKYSEEELPLVYEIRSVVKNGKILPVEISVSPYRVKGKVVGIEVIHRDITERKKAEEELVRLSSAVKMSTDSIVISDLYGKIIDVNKATLKMYGTNDKGDLIGKSSFDLIAPEEREKAFAGMEDILEKGYLENREYHIITKDDGRIPVEMSVAIMKDVDGRPMGFVGISRDITERKRMEERLRQYSEHLEELVQKRTEELLESETRYSVLVEEASDGVVIIQDGKIVFANKKAAPKIVGYSRGELIGLPLEKVVDEKHLQLVMERYMQRLRGEKVPPTYEIELIAKTGERVPVELSATPINYQGRPADLVIIRDITERKRIEKQRLKLEKLAAIGELATMVGHDLRNPLQAIENATYYLNNELPHLPIPQKTLEMLQIINNSVNYADKIVRDLHDFSATKKPTLKKTNINTIIKETLSQVETPNNVKLVTKLGHLPQIEADKDMIKRILLNLATNGIQAMEKGGTLKVSTKKTKGFVEVSFKDTGTGMSKENLKNLFTPFFTTKAKGMGMGLSICKKLVDTHGGSIEVESKEDKGSTFTVKLPIQQRMEVKTSGKE
jgi:PAS domain S-box-containing protein